MKCLLLHILLLLAASAAPASKEESEAHKSVKQLKARHPKDPSKWAAVVNSFFPAGKKQAAAVVLGAASKQFPSLTDFAFNHVGHFEEAALMAAGVCPEGA